MPFHPKYIFVLERRSGIDRRAGGERRMSERRKYAVQIRNSLASDINRLEYILDRRNGEDRRTGADRRRSREGHSNRSA
jgi:hypothetical protein